MFTRNKVSRDKQYIAECLLKGYVRIVAVGVLWFLPTPMGKRPVKCLTLAAKPRPLMEILQIYFGTKLIKKHTENG